MKNLASLITGKAGWPALVQGATILAFIILWELLGRTQWVFKGLMPAFLEILRSAWTQAASGSILPHLLVTLYEAGVGFAVAMATGLTIGFLLGTNRFLRETFEPPILYFAATPKIILYPLFLMLLGARLESKMAMSAVSAFFPIVINTSIGVMAVNRTFIKVAKSVGANRLQVYWRVYFPSILLPVFAGFRLGIGVALVGAILGELKVSNAGLGFAIISAFNHFRMSEMYGAILLTFAVAGVINLLMTLTLTRLRRFAAQPA